jgi:hypothetical protein
VYGEIVELYLLAQYLLDCTFQDAIIDKFLKTVLEANCSLPLRKTRRAWLSTPVTSPLRRLLVRFFAKTTAVELMEDVGKCLPLDMVISIMQDLARIREEPEKTYPLSYKYRCDYHIHNETAPRGPQCHPHHPVPSTKAN